MCVCCVCGYVCRLSIHSRTRPPFTVCARRVYKCTISAIAFVLATGFIVYGTRLLLLLRRVQSSSREGTNQIIKVRGQL